MVHNGNYGSVTNGNYGSVTNEKCKTVTYCNYGSGVTNGKCETVWPCAWSPVQAGVRVKAGMEAQICGEYWLPGYAAVESVGAVDGDIFMDVQMI